MRTPDIRLSWIGYARSGFEGCGHVADFLDKAKGVRDSFEAVVLIERRSSLVECIHDDDSRGDGLGRDDDPFEGIGQQDPSAALSMQALVQGKAGQQNGRYL